MTREWQEGERVRLASLCGTMVNQVSDGKDALACARLIVSLGLGQEEQGDLLWRSIVSRLAQTQNPDRGNFPDMACYAEALMLLKPS